MLGMKLWMFCGLVSFSPLWWTMLQLALNSYASFPCSSREWFITIFFLSLLGNLAWLHAQCSVTGGTEDLLGCWYAEINQNILTDILAGFQSAWLFGALSDSRTLCFWTDVKLTSLATCTVKREPGPSACMGGFWVKVELSIHKLSTFGVLHELDSHARTHCIVCVCVLLTLFFLFLSLCLLSLSLLLKMLPQMSVKVQVSLCVCTAAVHTPLYQIVHVWPWVRSFSRGTK